MGFLPLPQFSSGPRRPFRSSGARSLVEVTEKQSGETEKREKPEDVRERGYDHPRAERRVLAYRPRQQRNRGAGEARDHHVHDHGKKQHAAKHRRPTPEIGAYGREKACGHAYGGTDDHLSDQRPQARIAIDLTERDSARDHRQRLSASVSPHSGDDRHEYRE